jgi:hypothetical protein
MAGANKPSSACSKGMEQLSKSILISHLPEGWFEVDQPPKWKQMWEERHGGEVPVPRVFQHNDGRTALLGWEPYAADDWRWHISVRHGDLDADGRIPTWEELVTTAHDLRPGVPFVVGIPPKSWWLNVHPHVLHLVQTKDQNMIDNWRKNSRGDKHT